MLEIYLLRHERLRNNTVQKNKTQQISPVISTALIRCTRHLTWMSMTCRSMCGPPPLSVTHIGHNGARKGVFLHVLLSPLHIRIHITSELHSGSFFPIYVHSCEVPSSCDFYRRNFYGWTERRTQREEESKRISLHKHSRTSTTVCFASVILYCTCTRDRW